MVCSPFLFDCVSDSNLATPPSDSGSMAFEEGGSRIDDVSSSSPTSLLSLIPLPISLTVLTLSPSNSWNSSSLESHSPPHCSTTTVSKSGSWTLVSKVTDSRPSKTLWTSSTKSGSPAWPLSEPTWTTRSWNLSFWVLLVPIGYRSLSWSSRVSLFQIVGFTEIWVVDEITGFFRK